MSSRSLKKCAVLLAGSLLLGGGASAADYSFTGNFTQDDDVQLFNFTVGSDSVTPVVLRSWSYAGGVNADGVTIARGGFDPILALFDGSGAFIGQNDDGGSHYVDADPMTGAYWDVYLSAVLAAGNYTVAIMQYDNFAAGPNLSDGFERVGEGNFTPGLIGGNCGANLFCDVSQVPGYSQRDGHWAFDILNVAEADDGTPGGGPSVPEPATWVMLIAGFGLVGSALRRRRRLQSA